MYANDISHSTISSRKNSPKVAHLTQTVHLSSLGSPAFESVTDRFISIHELFSQQFPEGTMQPPAPSWFMHYPKIEVSTRYFTSRKSCPSGESALLSEDIDPCGTLTVLMGSDLYHGIDNQVQYFKMISQGDCKRKE